MEDSPTDGSAAIIRVLLEDGHLLENEDSRDNVATTSKETVWMLHTLKTEVAKTWGEPNSTDRLRKMRNTINTALGAQKAKNNASQQAIEKWEKD